MLVPRVLSKFICASAQNDDISKQLVWKVPAGGTELSQEPDAGRSET
jgi:hypothetical protein